MSTRVLKHNEAGAASSDSLPAEEAARQLGLFRRMLTIRAFEQQVRSLYLAGQIPGLVHLCAGQEATAVGVCAQLRQDDYIASNHRGHGHCLAKGADPTRLLAEILGREEGYGGGVGGSLHMFDAANGNLGTNGIVGGGVPLATGAGLSIRTSGQDRVAVCFFGDGTLNQGVLFECLNLAALWSLPVIFVCENNGYGEYTAIETVTAGTDYTERARIFGIHSEMADGTDIRVVEARMKDAVERARAGNGASFLIFNTARLEGHHITDKQSYKSEELRKEEASRDPIVRYRAYLEESGTCGSATLDRIEQEVTAEIKAIAAMVRTFGEPWPDKTLRKVYA